MEIWWEKSLTKTSLPRAMFDYQSVGYFLQGNSLTYTIRHPNLNDLLIWPTSLCLWKMTMFTSKIIHQIGHVPWLELLRYCQQSFVRKLEVTCRLVTSVHWVVDIYFANVVHSVIIGVVIWNNHNWGCLWIGCAWLCLFISLVCHDQRLSSVHGAAVGWWWLGTILT